MPRNEDDASATRLLDAKALARELGISGWLLGELRRRGVIPAPIRLGGVVRWRATTIAQMLDRLGRATYTPRSLRGAVLRQAMRKAGGTTRVRLDAEDLRRIRGSRGGQR